MLYDQESKVHAKENMVHFARALLFKVRLRTLLGDPEAAMKPLMKLNRLLAKKLLSQEGQWEVSRLYYKHIIEVKNVSRELP